MSGRNVTRSSRNTNWHRNVRLSGVVGILAAVSTEADLAFAAAFLSDRFGEQAGAPAELVGGEWSRAYAYDCGGMRWVIRFSRYEHDLAKDRLAGRYGCEALPIPVVAEMGEAAEQLWYAVTPYVEGRFLEDLDAEALRRALPAVLDMIGAMRAADTSAFTGAGGWLSDGRGRYDTWRSFLLDIGTDDPGQRTHGWRRALAANPAAERVFESALAALESAVDSCPERRDLVHNDLLHRNVFVDRRGRIAGVIDWANSMYGDSLYDLALLAFWSPWFQAIDEAVVVAQARSRLAAGDDDFGERLRAYQLHIGLDHIAYNAFLGPERRGEMERVCRRTADVVRRL